MNSNQNYSSLFYFWIFFAPEIQIFLILIGWFQIFGVRKNAGFSLVDLNFFAPNFGALNSSENFDAMNVWRDGKSPVRSCETTPCSACSNW